MLSMYTSDGTAKVNELTSVLLGQPCTGLSDNHPSRANTTSTPDGPAQSSRRTASLSGMDDLTHQLKGGSSSIGCVKVADACTRMRDAIKSGSEPDMRAAAQLICETYREVEAVITAILDAMAA